VTGDWRVEAGPWPLTLHKSVHRRLGDVSQRDMARRLSELSTAAASAGEWDDRQDLVRRLYQTAHLETWLQILWDARTGALPRDWRLSAASIAESATENVDAAFGDAERLAARAVLDDFAARQPWEPTANVGWRAALDGWFAAITRFDVAAVQTVSAGQLKWVIDDQPPAREHALFWARAVEQYRRMRDHHGAAYYAGLACGGLDVDWRQWYRHRIESWLPQLDDDANERPPWSRCAATLEALDQGALDEQYVMLPSYWQSGPGPS
jgi:hypothetical protein